MEKDLELFIPIDRNRIYKYLDCRHYSILLNVFSLKNSNNNNRNRNKFFKFLKECGIGYYQYMRSEKEYVVEKYYIECDKKFLIARCKYDF